jgi:putative flippase GtrA
MRQLLKLATSFSLVGATCTMLSLLMIYFFAAFTTLNATTGYIISYSSSILLSYLLSAKFVFKGKYSVFSLLIYIFIYLSSMGIGVALLKVLEPVIPFQSWIVSYFTIPVTMGWNFMMTRLLFR